MLIAPIVKALAALVARAPWLSVSVKPAAFEPETAVMVVPPGMFGPPMFMPTAGVKPVAKLFAGVVTEVLPRVVDAVAVRFVAGAKEI